jgi:hypothetical protein
MANKNVRRSRDEALIAHDRTEVNGRMRAIAHDRLLRQPRRRTNGWSTTASSGRSANRAGATTTACGSTELHGVYRKKTLRAPATATTS